MFLLLSFAPLRKATTTASHRLSLSLLLAAAIFIFLRGTPFSVPAAFSKTLLAETTQSRRQALQAERRRRPAPESPTPLFLQRSSRRPSVSLSSLFFGSSPSLFRTCNFRLLLLLSAMTSAHGSTRAADTTTAAAAGRRLNPSSGRAALPTPRRRISRDEERFPLFSFSLSLSLSLSLPLSTPFFC